ncbi:hypothetical protein [Pseudomonas sp. TH34]|uniref:hypothetical protein n=1 Tax=Pseudomonas sp. TH34 TaxID=2796399 RepID=UPI00406D35E1
MTIIDEIGSVPSDIGQIEWGCSPSPITLRLLSRYLNRTLKPMLVDLLALYPELIHLMLDTLFVVDRDNQIALVNDVREALLVSRAEELRLLPSTPLIRLSGCGRILPLVSCCNWCKSGRSIIEPNHSRNIRRYHQTSLCRRFSALTIVALE